MAAQTILHPKSLSLWFIGVLNLFHNLAAECWHVRTKREGNTGSAVLFHETACIYLNSATMAIGRYPVFEY